VNGYLNKNITLDILKSAIHTVMKGERYFSPEITALVFEDFYLKQTEGKGLPTPKKTSLSKREEEVLGLIANGKSLKLIAEELFISVKTVESHKSHIQDKLGLTNVAQLVKYAIENSVIEVAKSK
jgi:DNA-binding NarL/FixJ family response regulator